MIALYTYIAFLIFILILFFIMCFRLNARKYNVLWPITILKYCLPIICKTFYGQIFILLISAFKCKGGRLYYNSKIKNCKVGNWFYIGVPISSLAIIFQFILSYITNSMYYQADFIIEGKNLLKKRTSTTDIILLFIKMILIITFGFDKEKENEHWGILFVSCFVTGINVYSTLFLQYYENIIIKRLSYFYSLFLFWGFFSLLIGKIFISWQFNGAFYLFFFGLILIIIYCLFYAKTYLEFFHLSFNEINSSQNYINYIKSYLKIIKEKDISRDNSMILTTFIEKMEEGCTNKNCILKKYLESLSKGFDSNFLLLQFAQKLFKIAINKFPKDITLRIHYIIFLLTKINQKKNAKKELYSIKQDFIFLDENFKIYICKKYIEEYNTLGNKEKEETNENNDVFQSMEYKNNTIEFRRLLSKSSYLYYDFWSSLYSSHLQGTEDIKKLNDIGAELNVLIENTDKVFEKLREFKNNDLTIIKLYESYARYILNDKEKYEKYYNISMNLGGDNKIINKDIDFSNYDLNILSGDDEFKILVISANDENKGNIINITLNGCLIFGYHKNEIVGKNMNILIPELYHQIHNKIFNEKSEKDKTEFFENLSKNMIYNPKFEEFLAFGRNKSKYLIPLFLKIFFVQTEEGELAYIVKFDDNKLYDNDSKENENQYCCILTDNNLIIQTFTSNCVEILGLNSKIINSNYDITNFIKQFNEELQIMISSNNKEPSGLEVSEIKSSETSYKDIINNSSNINDKSFEQIIKLKKKLIKLKYSHPRKIFWNKYYNDKTSNNISETGKSNISLFAPTGVKTRNNNYNNEKNKNNIRKNFILDVKEAYISKKHIGYYFYFKKIKISKDHNLGQFDNPKILNSSPRMKLNSKRPSVKFYNIDNESAKSSRIYNEEDEESFQHNNSIDKSSIESTKRNSLVNLEIENNFHLRKHESARILSNIYKENDNNIDDKYVPKCSFNFFLDLETKSFKPSTKLDSYKELYQTLKFQSLQKINIIYKSKKKKEEKKDSSSKTDSSSGESIYSSNSYNSNSQDSSLLSNSSDHHKNSNINNSKNNTFKRKNNKRKECFMEKSIFNHKSVSFKNSGLENNNNDNKKEYDYHNEYYKVNINKIRLMVYDFNQEMIINSNNKIEKKSQVEIIIENYKSRNNINISEDSNYPNIFVEKLNKEQKTIKYKNSEMNLKRKIIKKENKESNKIFDKEKEFEKEVQYALSQQDEQESIIFFYKMSFIFFLFLILMGFDEILFIVNIYSSLKENLKLLIYSVNLKYIDNLGVYFIRETTLFSIINNITDGIYNYPNSTISNYKTIINDMAKETFIEGNEMIEYIIGTSLALCKETIYTIKEEPYNIEILYNNSNIKNVTSNLYTSIIQVYSAFCNLLAKSMTIDIDDPNLFTFIHNSFNNLGKMLNVLIKIFENELLLREKYDIIDIIINIIVFLILHIIIFFIISRSYCSIVIKKASYISVFYGIGLPLIKSSIKKCEIYINKINQNEENSKIKEIEEETSSLISSFEDNNLNKIFMENNFERKSININKNIEKPKKLKKSKNLGKDKNSKKFRIIFQTFLFLSFIYLCLNFYFFLNFSTYFIICGNYIFNMQNYHNNIYELFNIYREYLFDEKTIIFGLPSYEYLIYKEKIFYSTITENHNYLTVLSKKIKGLYSYYLALQKKGLCSSFFSYFNSEEECMTYIGGEDGIVSLGFDLFVNSFIEEIRNARNYMKLLLDKKILVGNLSEYIFSYYNDSTYLLNENNSLIFKMKVFNMNQTHYRLNIIFQNIILPYINEERFLTEDAIEKSVANAYLNYCTIIIVYIILILIFFIFYWIPMIKNLNAEIYKTKKMLSIIPIQILVSQPNIKELLNLSINNE